MKLLYNLLFRLMTALMIQRLELQQQLLETQRELIDTQRELDKVRKLLAKATPKNPKDKEVIWHIHSGIFSEDAANSNDLETIRGYRDWLTDVLGKKYIKPYVSPKVYMECVNQMTRGLSQRIAELQTREDLSFPISGQLPPSNGKSNLTLVRTGR